MQITPIKNITPAIVEDIKTLIKQLTEPRCDITIDSLNAIINLGESELLVAKDENDKIVGSMCLMVYTIPSTKKAFIEDVVVSAEARGKGYGKAMIEKAIEMAKAKGVKYIELSSNPKRIAANALYKKLGFKVRETNYYRMEI